MNKVLIIGRLGKDPQLSSQFSKIVVATSDKYKKDDQVVEKTEWHNVICFGNLSFLVAKYLKKGSQVLVEGKLQTTSWVDSKTGEKRFSTNIVANNIQFL